MSDLTTQDIANAVSIIDICVKRGAIEGNELTAVGTVRDKLAKHVEANGAVQSQQTEDDASE